MITAKLTTKFNRIPELRKRLRHIHRQATEVGWFAEQGEHPSNRSDITFAELAAVQHFGSSFHNIPPRPILSVGLTAEEMTNFATVQKGLDQYFSNIKSTKSIAAANRMLLSIGENLVADIKQLFGRSMAGIPPNSIRTATLKGKNTPLLESGALRDALMAKSTIGE